MLDSRAILFQLTKTARVGLANGRKQNGGNYMKRIIDQRLLSVMDAAKYLGRSETAVRELVWRGKIPHIRADRRIYFDIKDLHRWIEENRID